MDISPRKLWAGEPENINDIEDWDPNRHESSVDPTEDAQHDRPSADSPQAADESTKESSDDNNPSNQGAGPPTDNTLS